ncbi:unnamed protein product [Paramecium sonneborni]|uniref:Uncharacterized protein n=1 Tax=Paramecium sonneborni TaxID=65129 RepID=A0A8S1RMN2_9CILI|nr:unnamed protein product [Paramecium sonneborni]
MLLILKYRSYEETLSYIILCIKLLGACEMVPGRY